MPYLHFQLVLFQLFVYAFNRTISAIVPMQFWPVTVSCNKYRISVVSDKLIRYHTRAIFWAGLSRSDDPCFARLLTWYSYLPRYLTNLFLVPFCTSKGVHFAQGWPCLATSSLLLVVSIRGLTSPPSAYNSLVKGQHTAGGDATILPIALCPTY